MLIVSSLAEEGAEETVAALALGAADTLPKPGTGRFNGRFSEVLLSKLRELGYADRSSIRPATTSQLPQIVRPQSDQPLGLVAIGASTGGIHALGAFFAELPGRIGVPILVTQHLPPAFMSVFARQLSIAARREAVVAEDGTQLLPDRIVIAPPGAPARAHHAGSDGPPVLLYVGSLFNRRRIGDLIRAFALAAARAGATTGEWAGTLREVFGEFRAPTGVTGAVGVQEAGEALTAVRERVKATGDELGGRLRFLVGKPGLDGHSNGAEQVAVRARDAGFEVVYQGIRLTPEQIVAAAVAEDVHVVGLSILSGSHMELVPVVLEGLKAAGAGDIPVIVGGIIPESDGKKLLEQGAAAVYTPKDFSLTEIMDDIVTVIRKANGLA